MRLSQYYAARELSRYDFPVTKIAEMTGLTSVAVQEIQTTGIMPDIFLLQCDNEELAERCPHCGAKVFSPCYKCWQEKAGNRHVIEVIRRPVGHQAYMLNVHIFNSDQ